MTTPTQHRLPASLALAALTLLAACATPPAPGPAATASVAPTRGQTVSGTVKFKTMGDHVAVRVQLAGLPANSEHGFHLHEKGDCSAPDGMSTGGHFNPTGKPHGAPQAEHHAGDMPSLKSDATGRVDTEFMLNGITIGSGATDIVGRGLIVHAQRDDYTTQPTGDSGARIGCGVVTKD